MDRIASDGVVFYRSGLLHALGVRHGFSTRIGGVSTGVYASLNLGNPSDATERDPDANVAENYRRLSAASGVPNVRDWANQVHGCGVLDAHAGQPFEVGRPADAIVSDDPTRAACVRTADCAAVLIASAGGRVIAAIHAGWRGVVAGVIPAAIEAMRRRGAEPVAGAVFPCISGPNFEVGPEVVEQFRALNLPARLVEGGKGRADVEAACVDQLRRAGVRDVEASGLCTYAREDEFFSHRRERGRTGRLALVAVARGY